MYFTAADKIYIRVREGTATDAVMREADVTVVEPQIYTYRMSTAYGSSLRRNGVEILAPAALSAAAAVANHTEAFKLGRVANVANADALYFGDALYGAVLSDAECLAVEQYWNARFALGIAGL